MAQKAVAGCGYEYKSFDFALNADEENGIASSREQEDEFAEDHLYDGDG